MFLGKISAVFSAPTDCEVAEIETIPIHLLSLASLRSAVGRSISESNSNKLTAGLKDVIQKRFTTWRSAFYEFITIRPKLPDSEFPVINAIRRTKVPTSRSSTSTTSRR
jgi:hypothetical protein